MKIDLPQMNANYRILEKLLRVCPRLSATDLPIRFMCHV